MDMVATLLKIQNYRKHEVVTGGYDMAPKVVTASNLTNARCLTPHQQNALDWVVTRVKAGAPLVALRGLAGTGKTTLVPPLRAALTTATRAVQVGTPTHRAAMILRHKGVMDAATDAVKAALRLTENAVSALVMALHKAVRMMAWDTRINPHSRLAPALPAACEAHAKDVPAHRQE
jgi:hypothetical protein